MMKINIYVQQTWASLKLLSQAWKKLMKDHPQSLLVTLSEGMTFMNSLDNEELPLFYMLLVGVAFHNLIHFGVIIHFT